MLTARQKEILKIIVLEYIKLAKPVGSNFICDRLNCSSATVRSEMAELEELGLLEKTHISSGRVPSEAGYRYYVDNLMELKEMSQAGKPIFNIKELYTKDVLRPERPLLVKTALFGSIPNNGFSYTDGYGKIRYYAVSESGMDGSVVFSEF